MLSSLALLGGLPTFAVPLHVGCPNIGSRDAFLARVNGALDRRWLTNDGMLVREFETRIADLLGVRHCVAVNNATIGLELAVRALGMSGEVIVPSYTFIATAHALQWQGIRPVFCDIAPETHNLDPKQVARLITPATTGILATHVWGRGCDVDALQKVADEHGLKLLFDAAHAFLCSLGPRMIGSFGDAEVFSFHATKFVNAAEGGAITTNNDKLARDLRLMRNFGFSGTDCVSMLGTNAKMSEFSAAMGITSLEAANEFVVVNHQHYETYKERLSRIPGIRLETYNPGNRSNFQYIVTVIDPDRFGLTREELISVLHAEGVLARRYFWPGCHRQEPYRTLQPDLGTSLYQTETLAARVLQLPTGTAVSTEQIVQIGDLIEAASNQASAIRDALSG